MATKTDIPQGTDKESVYIRRGIIVANLYPLVRTSVPCKAFKKEVGFILNSIDETATHAAKSYLSTLAALRVVEALGKSELVATHVAKSKKQIKLNFKKVHELKAELSGLGTVKIIVGERAKGRVLHYCITKKSEKNPTNMKG